MTEVVNELKVFQGGARVPAVSSKPLATDSAGNLVASARQNVAFTTGSLANGASETDDVTVFKISKVIKVIATRACRIRAYSTSAYRTADASRAVTVDPTGDHGCLMELVMVAGVLTLDLAPAITLHNMDGSPATTIYFAVTNNGTTGTNTITLTLLQEE